MGVLSYEFDGMSGLEIDKIAHNIINSFQPEVFSENVSFDIVRFVDNNLEELTGIEVDYSNELPQEIHGLTDTESNRMVIQADLVDNVDSFSDEGFSRSTLAHETGHCVLHVPVLRKNNGNRKFIQENRKEDKIKLYRESNLKMPVYRNPEWQAWRFAGALLMPEMPLRKLIDMGKGLYDIAEIFKVNVPFLESRLKALKIRI